MTDREAMQQALDALERGETQLRYEAIAALTAALAEPEQEPVCRCDLRAEIERLRADAERLDWIIANKQYPLGFDLGWTMADEDGRHYGIYYATARQAIDAAREAK